MKKFPIKFGKMEGKAADGSTEISRFVYIGTPPTFVLAYHKRKSGIHTEQFIELTRYPRKYR